MNRPNIAVELRNIGYLINVAVTDWRHDDVAVAAWQRHKMTLPLPQGVFDFSRCRNVAKDVAATNVWSSNDVAATEGQRNC